MSAAEALEGGFADPAREAAAAFRALLDVMARPGRIRPLPPAAPPAPLSPAAGALLLTLVDATTPLHLAPSHDSAALRAWIAFRTGAPLVAAGAAAFALGTWAALQPVHRFAAGTPEYPDRAATLIVEMPALAAAGARLAGPGIRGRAWLNLPDPAAFAANRARWPLGFDTFLTAGDRVAALPRSTRVEAG
jgi:alpha-D-ribose 1-methylphosphonate 5-triphosphate synthase subunit PhnH